MGKQRVTASGLFTPRGENTGIRPTYNSLIEHWQLEEITNSDESSMPTTLEDLASVLTNYEQSSRKHTPLKPGNPHNFVTDDDYGRSNNNRGKGKNGGNKRGCITCSIAGIDSFLTRPS